ncbi:MAG: hypothetical protein ACR2NR_23800 [Solirubrobacteraceae bacterium]
MTPDSLRDLFLASAGVAGALIGLLFVAISVEHERLTAPDASQVHRVRASAALTSFTNSLTVSLFALVPGALGATALAVSVAGLLFVAGSLLSLWRARRLQPVAPRDALFVIGLAITFGFQLFYGLRLSSDAGDRSAADGIAVLVIICFLIGIARSWELIGGPSIGLGSEVTAIVREHVRHDPPADDPGPASREDPEPRD